MSFAPQYIRGMTGQHLGLQWFAFLSWAGWQFEVTWQQEMFVAVLALKKRGTGQAMWHLLLGRWTDPFRGIFQKRLPILTPEKDARKLFYWTCHRVSLLSVRVRIVRGRRETEFYFVLPPTASHPHRFTVQMWVQHSLPSFPNWCRPLVQQGYAKKPLSQGFSGRHCVRSPFLGFYFFISFPSQWCCTLESTVSNSAFCSSN